MIFAVFYLLLYETINYKNETDNIIHSGNLLGTEIVMCVTLDETSYILVIETVSTHKLKQTCAYVMHTGDI